MKHSILLLMLFPTLLLAQPTAEQFEFFEKKIRPVLAEQCYSCHSQKAKKVKAGLYLDSRAAILKGGENGSAIQLGNPNQSLLIKAISYKDVDLQMPPRGKLPLDVTIDFAKWIREGAAWPDEAKVVVKKSAFDLAERKKSHWSWHPIRMPELPAVKNAEWGKAPIDRFVLQKLEAKGLTPARPATSEAIVRRLAFDLTGLPPEPKMNEMPVEKLVDQLLASPAFGERWGRHWLDLMRYAESRGHEFDYIIPNAYQYRDYVIRALNADVPYDQFVREHLAGDLMKPRLSKEGWNESILGTGFWFLGEQVHSPVDICQDRADRMDNMLDVMTKSFLGLTVACARCHDHKFDAISTKDYYALAGFLESSSYRLAPFESMEHNRQIAEKLWKLRDEYRPKLQKAFAEAAEPGVLALMKDKKQLAGVRSGRVPLMHEQAQVIFPAPRDAITSGLNFGPGVIALGQLRFGASEKRPIEGFAEGIYAEVDPFWDGSKGIGDTEPGALGRTGKPGRALRTPKFDVGPGKIFIEARGAGTVYAAVEGHIMVQGPLHGRLVQPIKAGPEFKWIAIDLAVYQGRRVHLEFTPDSSDFALAFVVQTTQAPDWQPANINEDRLAALTNLLKRWKSAEVASTYWHPLVDACLANWILEHPEIVPLTDALSKASEPYFAEVQKLKAQVKWESRLAPAMLDGNGVDERVFIRGNYKTPGEIAPRRFLEALNGPEPLAVKHGSGRLQLAEQMTDPKRNPYFTRVFVNRVWHHLFGRGIVGSTDNFGVLGEAPTHPELLDYLADDFAKNGYSLKKLIRTMVQTKTYQLAAEPDANAVSVDPANLLLQHRRVRRLEGEAIRDSILAISGKLDVTPYGPSTPIFLNAFQDGRGKPGSGPLDGNGRRSIYLAVKRNFLSSLLLAFDQPIPFSSVGKRSVSNVPAQALIMLNDPFVHQESARWAKRVLAEKGTPEERIARMYRAAFNRPPSNDEREACLAYVGAGEPERWTGLAHVLFNSKEFIFLP